jgi:hypothetical protein
MPRGPCMSPRSSRLTWTQQNGHRLMHSGVIAALEAAALGIDLQQAVDGIGLEPGRFGHALGGAAGRCAQETVGALRRENAHGGNLVGETRDRA